MFERPQASGQGDGRAHGANFPLQKASGFNHFLNSIPKSAIASSVSWALPL